jgi:hypothetical protein
MIATSVPTTMAGSDASGPKAPPLRNSGAPGLGLLTSQLSTTGMPETEAPQTQPWVKFQAAWTPIDIHRRPVSR